MTKDEYFKELSEILKQESSSQDLHTSNSALPQMMEQHQGEIILKTEVREILRVVDPWNPSTHSLIEERRLLPNGGEHRIITKVKYHDSSGLQLKPDSRIVRCISCGRIYDLDSKIALPCDCCGDYSCPHCGGEVEKDPVIVRQQLPDGRVLESIQRPRKRVCARHKPTTDDLSFLEALNDDPATILYIVVVISLLLAIPYMYFTKSGVFDESKYRHYSRPNHTRYR